MKILVIGSGGREHALVWALKQNSARPVELFCAPGNAGIAELAECVPIGVTDVEDLIKFCERENVDLTMVGPEVPLAAGIVDEFEARGLRIIGPGREAAQLEASKAFAKDFMGRHKIPTARYRVASTRDEATDILTSGAFGDENSPVVIKADGLAAGKGVVVAKSRFEAQQAVDDLITGSAETPRIIIEEALAGREASLLLFSDGKNFRLMPAARDHKRIGENDTGPNTGGMGTITDSGVLDPATLDVVIKQIVEPTLRGASDEGYPFRGVLFIGLMLTANGPQVLEYNVRFGDPETQAILVRLESDLVDIFEGICDRRLDEVDVKWSSDCSACVVLAAAGYPGKPKTGARIEGLRRAAEHENVQLFHAATSRDAGHDWLTAGGRVIGVTATGKDLDTALNRAYAAVGEIHWEGMQYRRDIGRPVVPPGGSRWLNA
ncbi:MAG TPA: phosphoribosylamine--glycine ligase, partial [Pyrinomonadaceae bacterium]|nr:phosphoribosylamine--glycine ligase [Pyrinomonadaceae bacterium]